VRRRVLARIEAFTAVVAQIREVQQVAFRETSAVFNRLKDWRRRPARWLQGGNRGTGTHHAGAEFLTFRNHDRFPNPRKEEKPRKNGREIVNLGENSPTHLGEEPEYCLPKNRRSPPNAKRTEKVGL
jgi:hypothetical protein